MKRIGVYRIFNTKTEKSYVGSSVNLDDRKAKHFWALEKGTHGSPKLQNSYKKHGARNFIFEVLEECTEEELAERETAWIDLFNSIHAGYNITRDMMHWARTAEGQARRLKMAELKYPANWSEIRARILQRDDHKCVKCGVKNFSVVQRFTDGTFELLQETTSHEEARLVADEATLRTGKKHIYINLACAHLLNPDPLDCRDENLAMLCFYHHSEHDRVLHSKNARVTGRKKRRVVRKKKAIAVNPVYRKSDMGRVLAVRTSEEQMAKIEAEADRQKLTLSDIVRQAIDAFFSHGPREATSGVPASPTLPVIQEKRPQSQDTLLQRLDVLEYEIAKSRAVTIRSLEMTNYLLGTPEILDADIEELIHEAGLDATMVIEKRRQAEPPPLPQEPVAEAVISVRPILQVKRERRPI